MERMTVDQIAKVEAGLIRGADLERFAANNPDIPQEHLREYWAKSAAWYAANPLKPGQYYGVPSEWQ